MSDETSLDKHTAADFANTCLMQVRQFSAEYRVKMGEAVRQLLSATGGAAGEAGFRRRKQYERARDLHSGGRPILVKESVFQLVPGVSSSWCSGVRQAVWRHGYWHIARSQVRSRTHSMVYALTLWTHICSLTMVLPLCGQVIPLQCSSIQCD